MHCEYCVPTYSNHLVSLLENIDADERIYAQELRPIIRSSIHSRSDNYFIVVVTSVTTRDIYVMIVL